MRSKTLQRVNTPEREVLNDMELLKDKRVRLKGKALRDLNDAIHERDSDSCIICGSWVDRDIKFHHEPCGIKKSDEIEKGVTLCPQCHYKRHNTAESKAIREKCEKYLAELYDGDRQ